MKPASTSRCYPTARWRRRRSGDIAVPLTRRSTTACITRRRASHKARRLRVAADRRSRRRGRRASALCRQARLQGCDAARHGPRKFLDDKRFWPIYARAENSTCRSPAPVVPRMRGDRGLLRRPHQEIPHGGAAGLGLHGRRRHGDRMVLGRVRRPSAPESHSRPPRRDAAFLVWRIDHALARPRQKPLSFRDVFCSNFTSPRAAIFQSRCCAR